MIFNLQIFDRHCQLVFYIEWHRLPEGAKPLSFPMTTAEKASLAVPDSLATRREDGKLVYGIVVSLKTWMAKFAATPPAPSPSQPQPQSATASSADNAPPSSSTSSSSADTVIQRPNRFLSLRTSTYKLHFYESLSGVRLVILTDPLVGSMYEALRQIYANSYVEYVVKNPLSRDQEAQAIPISNDHFNASVDNFVRSLGVFDS
ncbi:hypothetical protein GQ42DRAFT_118651 [Ramicandelaber brevisporus]|nr:hypothetical protein GQ42DRAFT_118651 [Ramicandelaber brevisporus]